MRHLTGHHIDLVGQGDGNDHVRFIRPSGGKHVGLRTVSDKSPHVERVAHELDMTGRCVDNGDVVLLGGKPLGDAVSDLPCSANDYPHDRSVRPNIAFIIRRAISICDAAPNAPCQRTLPCAKYCRRTG